MSNLAHRPNNAKLDLSLSLAEAALTRADDALRCASAAATEHLTPDTAASLALAQRRRAAVIINSQHAIASAQPGRRP